jgi:hypothetical protein
VELAVLIPYQPVNFEVDTAVLYTQDEGRDIVKYVAYSKSRESAEPRRGPGRRTRHLGLAKNSLRSIERGRQLPPVGIERLTALAAELTAADNLAGGSEMSRGRRIAMTLEAHLRDSGIYAYSLNMAVADPHSDPVEDFLFNRQRRHCEYFASALALMLRAVEVPARLVTGFKGADPLASAGYYEVQQRHAHAWVEAFVDNQWIVLDPTPAARDEFVREVAARMGFWKSAGNSLSTLWSTYVVSLSLNRQQQTLYELVALKPAFEDEDHVGGRTLGLKQDHLGSESLEYGHRFDLVGSITLRPLPLQRREARPHRPTGLAQEFGTQLLPKLLAVRPFSRVGKNHRFDDVEEPNSGVERLDQSSG